MKSSMDKRLANIEAALAALQRKDRAYLVFYRGNDPEAELQWHIDAGLYDPATQEPFIIETWGPRKRGDPKAKRNDGGPNSELPVSPLRKEAVDPRPSMGPQYLMPDESDKDVKPQKRVKINYPDFGLA
jgi:hypothetical protein